MSEALNEAYSRRRREWRAEFEVWLAERDLPGSPDTRLAVMTDTAPRNAADELLLGGAP